MASIIFLIESVPYVICHMAGSKILAVRDFYGYFHGNHLDTLLRKATCKSLYLVNKSIYCSLSDENAHGEVGCFDVTYR